MMNGSTGLCSVCSDYMYSPSLGQCSNDRRPSQLTAFLLSLFVSSTGAANFYIGRNDLGTVLCILSPHQNNYYYVFL